MIDFYCIYKENDNRSEILLNDCITSGKQFDINVIPYKGIYDNIQETISKLNLKINDLGAHKIRTIGVLGCFLSHYMLWNKCLKYKRPIGVLEYDAVFIKKIPTDILDKFDHYLNLDYSRHLYLDSGNLNYHNFVINDNRDFSVNNLEESKVDAKLKKPFKYINNNNIKGAFGYIIKPLGAELLINATKKYGILPADIQPNLLYCNIQYTIPSIVMLNYNSLQNRSKFSHTAKKK